MVTSTYISPFVVVSCGAPVFHGDRDSSGYLEGSKIELLGCRHGYSIASDISIPVNITCQANGNWLPSLVNVSCEYCKLKDKLYHVKR